VFDDHILVEVTFDPGPAPDTAYFTAAYTVYYVADVSKTETPTKTVEDVTLYMTGRHLGGCLLAGENGRWSVERGLRPSGLRDFVTFEESVPPDLVDGTVALPSATTGTRPSVARTAAMNALASHIRERTVASVNSLQRYPAGKHTFLETDFATRRLLRAATGSGFTPLAFTAKPIVPHDLPGSARDVLSRQSLADILRAPSVVLSRQLNVSTRQIVDTKLASLKIPRTQRR
jgi:hypothetical protein